VVLRVGDVEPIAFEREPLRAVETRPLKTAVRRAARARADGVEERAVETRDDDAVVVRVRDEEAPAALVGQHLAGEGQRQVANLSAFQGELERTLVERAASARVFDEFADGTVEQVVVALARRLAYDVARRVYEDERRPRAHGVGVPDAEVGVVDDGVFEAVAEDDAAYVLGLLFVLELGRVDADDDELARVLLFEPLEVGDDVHAVDAAVSPEVEQHDLAAQARNRERPVGVEPAAPALKLGRAHAPLLAIAWHRFTAFLVLRPRARGRQHQQPDGEGEHDRSRTHGVNFN
jgi:hypothetical protein